MQSAGDGASFPALGQEFDCFVLLDSLGFSFLICEMGLKAPALPTEQVGPPSAKSLCSALAWKSIMYEPVHLLGEQIEPGQVLRKDLLFSSPTPLFFV